MAVDLPAWGHKAIDKLRRWFFWRGRKEAKGGHCHVAWSKVCRPVELGGLGISSLKELGWALRMGWLWLHKTESSQPWSALPIRIPEKVQAFFTTAMQVEIGDGSTTLFWQDRWLHGQRIVDVAPRLVAAVPKKTVGKCTVLEALIDNRWISDIRGATTVGAIAEYLILWDILSTVGMQMGVIDIHSVKAAHEGFFFGSVQFEHFEKIWKSWTSAKCHYFVWLVAHKKCWTADQLARHGLDHLEKCPLCNQDEETIDHLLVSCVFAKQFWFEFLRQANLQGLAPQSGTVSFLDWWTQATDRSMGMEKRGINSLIILGAWTLWKHWNCCVFYAMTPNLVVGLAQAAEDRKMWELAGAKGVSFLMAQLSGG
jgi:hypothetical protein